ncbi:MAG: GAF domain-containing sensor histidine kinase [Polyangia bacterium]
MTPANEPDRLYQQLLRTLEQLLELPAVDLRTALNQATQLIHQALHAEKVDAFLYDPLKNTLRAMGSSDTPLSQLQLAQGLDVLPLANRGSVVEVYTSGNNYLSGHVDEDRNEVPGIVHALGVRSHIAVPLEVAGERRGVLSAQSQTPDFFTAEDLRFLLAVSRCVGAVAHRAELVEAMANAALERGRRAAADELVLILAHDLRNYLGPLRGRIELLRLRAVRESRSSDIKDAEMAVFALERLSRMISDLLDVGRLEQGLFALQPVPVELVSLAQEIAQSLGTPEVGVQVTGPTELVTHADPERLRHLLENLIGNAIRYSPRGRPVIVEVRAEVQHETAQRQAILEVTDQGPGVPQELLPNLFERFVKTRGSPGLGLGLYLARRIAHAHGGELTVRSQPGHGACFRLTLPIEPAA